MYDNNILGTQEFLDGVGEKLDNVGEAINGFFSDAYSWVTG